MAEILFQLKRLPDHKPKSQIVWLTEKDAQAFNDHLILAGQNPIAPDRFRGFYQQGIARYCLLYHKGLPVARGAIEPLSDRVWEASDIRTARQYRNQGFAKDILLFLCQHILAHGRIATCRTEEDNLPMQKVMQSVGFQVTDASIYP